MAFMAILGRLLVVMFPQHLCLYYKVVASHYFDQFPNI